MKYVAEEDISCGRNQALTPGYFHPNAAAAGEEATLGRPNALFKYLFNFFLFHGRVFYSVAVLSEYYTWINFGGAHKSLGIFEIARAPALIVFVLLSSCSKL